MKFTVVLHPEKNGGYSVSVPALPGCYSEGETREEALANIKEAIRLHLEVLKQRGKSMPVEIVESIEVAV
jgi:predicted RNase H-like HicB family nuclease